jgi:hypothetical protein
LRITRYLDSPAEPVVPTTNRALVTHRVVVEVESSSRPGEYHEVSYAGGVWTCDEECQGFRYRGTCAHVREAPLIARERGWL